MATQDELAHEVLRSLRKIVRRVSQHSKSLYREVGLTVPQLVCLKAIGELDTDSDEVTVAMVAKRTQLSAATVSRIIDRLTLANLVSRERRSKDRRKVCLSLTAIGRDRFSTLPKPLHESFVSRLSSLPPEERQALLEALKRITQLMDADDIDAAPLLTHEVDVKSAAGHD